jgi:hypothetical protein
MNEVRTRFTLNDRTAAGTSSPYLACRSKMTNLGAESRWKCFSQLLDDPRACRMLCDIEVQDAPKIVTDDEKTVERAECDRRNSEEIHCGNRFPVIAEKGKPALGRLRISRCPFHPTRSARWVLNNIRPNLPPVIRGHQVVGIVPPSIM